MIHKYTQFRKCYPNELGEVYFKITPQAQRVAIYINREGRISVTIPHRCPFHDAEDFLLSKLHVLVAKRNAIEQQRQNRLIQSPINTRLHELKIAPAPALGIRRSEGLVIVEHPPHLPPTAPEVQQLARSALTEIYRAEAKAMLPLRTNALAMQHGFRYNKVTIRNTRTRWGSCSASNNISLSLNLMQLPDHLVDYVILHELCHTVVKNHSNDFWQLLDSTCGGRAKALAREVKHHAANL
ncbi:MAG: M48 family metallopeptidase [Bacteroidales bacterium]|nr:M48 family metallopeptidase [Bacteroidales bacterium]